MTRTPLLLLAALALAACAGAALPADEPAPEGPPVAVATTPSGPAIVGADEAGPAMTARAYVHGSMNLRAGPGSQYPVVAEVGIGAELAIGRPDAGGWAKVYDPGQFSATGGSAVRGWIYTKSTRLRATPPRRR